MDKEKGQSPSPFSSLQVRLMMVVVLLSEWIERFCEWGLGEEEERIGWGDLVRLDMKWRVWRVTCQRCIGRGENFATWRRAIGEQDEALIYGAAREPLWSLLTSAFNWIIKCWCHLDIYFFPSFFFFFNCSFFHFPLQFHANNLDFYNSAYFLQTNKIH